MKKAIKKFFSKLSLYYYRFAIYRCEMKKIRKKKNLWKSVTLDKITSKEIKKKYGTKDYWHRYYQYFTGKFDIDYIPEILFSTKLEPILNKRYLTKALEDKSLLHTLYGDVENLYIPKTIVQKTYGIYFDTTGNPISCEEALKIVDNYLKKYGKAIIKPTIETSSGENVRILSLKDNCTDKYKDNFIIQELVENQADIKRLNPNSLNTMRVITYICGDEYFVAPIILRMGGGASHLDNAHAGGIFISVDDNGVLGDKAYSEFGGGYQKHPYTNVKFQNYKIVGVDKIKQVAIKCHQKTPQLKMISWDLTINKDGVPTLIESNQFGQAVWMSQIAHGKSFFGKNTDKMLELIKKNK